MKPDFSAQFRPHYSINESVMRAAWWWTMWWPLFTFGPLPSLQAPQLRNITAISRALAGGGA
jgi:hypothetical protein